MKRIALACVALIPCGYFAYLWYGRAANDDPFADMAKWTPTAVEIHQSLQADAGKNGTSEGVREDEFAHLFQSRYREHQPQQAIGLKFLPKNRLKLMCPARMEPWDADMVALAAWKESRAEFGHPFDVDIFETYIGTAPIKIGELRALPGQPEKAHIVYTYRKQRLLASDQAPMPEAPSKPTLSRGLKSHPENALSSGK